MKGARRTRKKRGPSPRPARSTSRRSPHGPNSSAAFAARTVAPEIRGAIETALDAYARALRSMATKPAGGEREMNVQYRTEGIGRGYGHSVTPRPARVGQPLTASSVRRGGRSA